MRILYAEDSKFLARQIRRVVAELGHEVDLAADGAEAWRAIQAGGIQLVISDWEMPGMDGLTLCRHVREGGLDGYLYFILLTGTTEASSKREALAAGVDDFLTKPLDTAELAARLRVAERILRWESQLQQVNEALLHGSRQLAQKTEEIDRMRREAERLASHDFLTGVLNRRAWFEQSATPASTSLVLFDIDDFKRVNDTYGHPTGDAVLVEVARRLASALSPHAKLARVGGEEFAGTFTGTAAEAVRICEQAVEKVRSSPVRSGETVLSVTISAGLATWVDGVERTFDRADKALYTAKATGKNRLAVLPDRSREAA